VSTVIEILKATEEVLLPDGRRILVAALERVVDADRGDRVISSASSSSRGDASSRSAPSTVNVPGGMPVTNNFSGQPSVHVVGRGRVVKPPMWSMKSKIVPEPDQIQSAPPVRQDLPHRT